MIKGGVWKNTEDEILKAAVMKYGKNQWARISSLLVRKSAKQCKARWYEWLDPSIKKTEWTREEDEKLLHLAKLMPTQWRTIAPIVGRTPSQCLERYEKLLDAACVKDESYEPADDPRKLRPGEIDPNPESKPARPDPVDMDEDEKEMLSEARARLANTRGKKAKRKAREKQLEEARRLASLQKRRELKAAGIEGKQRRRKRKGIDYNAEIPFEKKPPAGFFDVSDEETRQVEQPNFPTTIEELEGKRRVDIEAQLRKQDVARNKIMQRHDAPSAVMQVNKLNDPEAVRKRAKLMLPSPQISDRELEEIAKMGYASDLVLGEDELAEGSGAARALLANYGQTPRLGMTPLRTPQRTPGGKGDAIMMEAENQARLRESQTPLFGGENPELHPSDFSGVTPKKREIQTPNPIATPMHTPGAVGLTPRIGMTPSREFSMTPKGTPIRDELHINEGMETPDSSKAESRRQAEIRRNLLAGLSDLPVPKNEYQIVVPELPTEDIEVGYQMEEDMSDKLARERAEEAARQAALLRKRSKVLQRDLPRPPISSVDFIKNSLTRVDDDKGFVPTNFIEQADELIRKELVSLLEHDNAKYPFEEDSVKEKKKGSKGAPNGRPQVPIPYIDDFDVEELNEAAQLIEEEVSVLRVGMGHEDASVDEFSEAHDACLEDMMYFPGRNSYGLGSVASVTDKLAATQNDFENVRNHMESETRKALRLEQKLKVLTQGYNMRAGKLWTQIEAAFKQADTSGTELECFRSLHKQEQLAASNRIEALREAVNQQKEFERQLQLRYQNLLVEQDNSQRHLQEQKEKMAHQKEQENLQRLLKEQKEKMARQKEQDNLERLLQEQKEKLAHQKDSRKENAIDTQQSESAIAQTDASHLENSSSEAQPFAISSKCNDVEMLDGSGIAGEKTGELDGSGIAEEKTGELDGSGIAEEKTGELDGSGIAEEKTGELDGSGIAEERTGELDGSGIAEEKNGELDGSGIAEEKNGELDGSGIAEEKNSELDGGSGIAEEKTGELDGSGIAKEKTDGSGIAEEKTGELDGSGIAEDKTSELDGSGIAEEKTSDNNSDMQIDCVPQSDGGHYNSDMQIDCVPQSDGHNNSDMQIDSVPQSDGHNPVLESEIVEQNPHQTKDVMQSDAKNIVVQDEKIVLQDENIDLITQSDGQNSVFRGDDVEQVKHSTSLVAQSDEQNDAIHNESVEQVKNQQELADSSIYSQNVINKDATTVSVEMQHPIQNSTDGQNDAIHNENVLQLENQQEAQALIYSQNDINKDAAAVSVEMQPPIQNSTDGQNDAIHNDNVLHVENQQELAQPSIYSQNDINKDATGVSVAMQHPIQNSTDGQNDARYNENVGQVENQQELAQSSTYSLIDINNDAAALSVDMQQPIQNIDMVSSHGHLKEQLNDSDIQAQDVSAQTQQSVGDKTDTVMGVCKVTSQEPVPLCTSDTEREIVVSTAQVETAAAHTEDVNLQS